MADLGPGDTLSPSPKDTHYTNTRANTVYNNGSQSLYSQHAQTMRLTEDCLPKVVHEKSRPKRICSFVRPANRISCRTLSLPLFCYWNDQNLKKWVKKSIHLFLHSNSCYNIVFFCSLNVWQNYWNWALFMGYASLTTLITIWIISVVTGLLISHLILNQF